jgi:hypothetical protein
MVAGEGFEPSKAEPGDLQSPPIGRSGNPPGSYGLRRLPYLLELLKSALFRKDDRHLSNQAAINDI